MCVCNRKVKEVLYRENSALLSCKFRMFPKNFRKKLPFRHPNDSENFQTHEVTDDKRKFLVSDIKNKKTRKHPLRFSSKAEKPPSKIHFFKHFECFEGNLNHPYPLIPIKNSTLLRVFFTRSNTISMALLAGTTPFKARRRM